MDDDRDPVRGVWRADGFGGSGRVPVRGRDRNRGSDHGSDLGRDSVRGSGRNHAVVGPRRDAPLGPE
ncbi:hypothetical protein GCM10012286_64240 [Streptomyces lasiicapitis]|uniref:Uncharacterized protein n=1 Tax=Streptomyces lasiicapitis TaxID=1923961 RepID=A0ABQ2MMA9_9ACTN|nr:hypothetical protein GCM10012286_64240 [Streptomyces lasiicapitis]